MEKDAYRCEEGCPSRDGYWTHRPSWADCQSPACRRVAGGPVKGMNPVNGILESTGRAEVTEESGRRELRARKMRGGVLSWKDVR